MRSHRSTWSLGGSGWIAEKRFFGVWFYERVITQKWSPLMHEFQRERGIRIGHMRFGLTDVRKKFFDGNEPSVIKGAF